MAGRQLPPVEATDHDGYRTYIRHYIVPYVGHIRLDQLNGSDCEAMWESMARQPKQRGQGGEKISVSTIHNVRRVLRSCLANAERRGLVGRNAAADARPPRLVAGEIDALNAEEARRVIDTAHRNRNAARWVVALSVGLRQGEALGLCWEDLDLDTGRISIRRTVYRSLWRHGCGTRPCGLRAASCPARHTGGLQVGTPKSTAGTRAFALPTSAVTALRQHRTAQAAERLAAGEDWTGGPYGGFVFATPTGKATDSRVDWAA